MEKQNREQRRAARFGRHQAPTPATKPTTWPESNPNPVFGADPTDDAVAGRPDQDQTEQTGPGAGGATEQAGRKPRREGTHSSNSTKG